jgi:uncharacterized repeat protein (TIGR03803 family)
MNWYRSLAIVGAWLLVAPGVASAQEDYQVVRAFQAGHPQEQGGPETPLVKGADGNLYFGGVGGLYRMRPDGSVTQINSLSLDTAPIQGRDGYLYATGSYQIFRIALTGEFTSLATFSDEAQGTLAGPLVEGPDGNIYGTSRYHDPNAEIPGRIFRMTPSGEVTTAHEFSDSDFLALAPRLYGGRDGHLYGSTSIGAGGFGTLFKLSMDGTFTTIHEFTGGPGGSWPDALFQRHDGVLYGVVGLGGLGYGGIFKLGADGEGFTVLRMFSGAPDEIGGQPTLSESADGVIHVATIWSIFSISALDEYRLLHSNASIIGSDRWGAYLTRPVEWHDGNFYGTAFDGGPGGNGVIYRLNRQRSACANIVELMVQGDETYTALYLRQVLKSEKPAYLGAWFVSRYGVQTMWSGFVAAFTPTVVFEIVNSDMPPLGHIGVFSLVITADLRVCSAWETIDTGGTGATTTEALQTLTNHLQRGTGK